MDASVARKPRRRTVRLADGEMSLLDFGDPARPVDVVWVHANGFHAETYRTVLQPLSAGLRILAPDLRGHGASTLPTDAASLRDWTPYARDLRVLLDGLEGPPPVVAGHSMGATSGLLAVASQPGRARALALFEPVILSRLHTLGVRLPGARARMYRHFPLVRGALGRRRRFPDRAEALAAYRGRGAFRTWPEASLADYVAGGFRDAGEEVELACTPEWEAANFAAQGHDARAALRAVARAGVPVRILKGGHGSTCAVSRPRRGVAVEIVEGAGHFLPLERPDLVREALLEAAAPATAQAAPRLRAAR